MIGLTNSYAHRLVKKGITSNAVSPGMCDSDMLQDMMSVVGKEKVVGMTGPGRLGTADEVATVVVMLARNGYVNGQVIGVDGGIHKKVRHSAHTPELAASAPAGCHTVPAFTATRSCCPWLTCSVLWVCQ